MSNNIIVNNIDNSLILVQAKGKDGVWGLMSVNVFRCTVSFIGTCENPIENGKSTDIYNAYSLKNDATLELVTKDNKVQISYFLIGKSGFKDSLLVNEEGTLGLCSSSLDIDQHYVIANLQTLSKIKRTYNEVLTLYTDYGNIKIKIRVDTHSYSWDYSFDGFEVEYNK